MIEEKYQAHLANIQQIRDEQEYGILYEQAETLLRNAAGEAQVAAGTRDYKGSAAHFDQGIEAAEAIIAQLRSDRFAGVRTIMQNSQSLAEQAEQNLEARVLSTGLARANMLVAGAKSTAEGPFNESRVNNAEELIELTVSANNARFLTARTAEARATTVSIIAGADQLRQIRLDEEASIKRAAAAAATAERDLAAAQAPVIASLAEVIAKPVDTLMASDALAPLRAQESLIANLQLPEGVTHSATATRKLGDAYSKVHEVFAEVQAAVLADNTANKAALVGYVAARTADADRIESEARAAAEQVVGVDGAKANRLAPVVAQVSQIANANQPDARPAATVADRAPAKPAAKAPGKGGFFSRLRS